MFRVLKNSLNVNLKTNNLFKQIQRLPNLFRPAVQHRSSSDISEIVIGGGLEKPQGGLKEEKYFYEQNHDLIAKIGQEGAILKPKDSHQYEKVLNASDDRTALRDTCSLNKHKNCLEEAFFLNEHSECCQKLCKEDDLTKNETNSKNDEIVTENDTVKE